MTQSANSPRKFHLALLALVLIVMIWSGLDPKDRLTWVLEVFPAWIGLALLIPTYRKFRLTNLLYVLIALHMMILCVGGKYTYAEVPAGFWFRDFFHLHRNHYDRLGHLAQGFVPAILARELYLRKHVVAAGKSAWLFFLVTMTCLGFSAFYELIEWTAALLSKEASESFLGTQGDNWDTQWDMFLALVGALSAQITLSRWHDRELKGLGFSRSSV